MKTVKANTQFRLFPQYKQVIDVCTLDQTGTVEASAA